MLTTLPHRLTVVGLALAASLLVAGCASGPSAAGQPSTAPSSSTASSSADDDLPSTTTAAGALLIDITLADGTVTPNGAKYDVTKGQTIVLNVTSDHDDEIHVHSEPEVELEVAARQPVSRQFTVEQSGSFEVESHHPEKIIAILNVR